MREVTLAGKVIPLRATPPALLFYRQEFGADMTADFVRLMSALHALSDVDEGDMVETMRSFADADLDVMAVYQLAWAMAKAGAGTGKAFPGFERWLIEISEGDGVELFDQDFFTAVLEVAADGMFRRAAQ